MHFSTQAGHGSTFFMTHPWCDFISSRSFQVVQIKGDAIRHAWHTLWEEPILGEEKNNLTAGFISMYPAKLKWRSDLFSPELDDPYSTLLVKRSF